MSNICKFCHHANREENLFCTQCGTAIESKPPDIRKDRFLYLKGIKHSEEELKLEIVNGAYTIGRSANNDIRLDDSVISRKHAMLIIENDEFFIEDLESRNGVFINGIRIRNREQIYSGYLLKFGNIIFKFITP